MKIERRLLHRVRFPLRLLKIMSDDVRHDLLESAKIKGKVYELEKQMDDMQAEIKTL